MYTDDYNLGLCGDLKDPFAVDTVLSSLSAAKYATRI